MFISKIMMTTMLIIIMLIWDYLGGRGLQMVPLLLDISSLNPTNSDFSMFSSKEWRCVNWREALKKARKLQMIRPRRVY